jgi:beta-N-acetylhexosaminidase
MAYRFLLILLLFIFPETKFLVEKISNNNSKPTIVKPFFTENENVWVDSVFNSLTLDQKIGQLFIVAAYSNQGEGEYQKVDNLIQKYNIGGLIFMQGTPKAQARLTNRYQNIAKVPLLISFDGEWGLGMRLSNVISYPKAITLGAINDNRLIYKMGADIAEQFHRLGIHLNFAPDADVNSNSENPVIGFRSFGEDKNNVAKKAIAYMKGLQNNGIIANAKHFPGHGDTGTDSHFSLPKINHSIERLTDVDLFPFDEMIKDSLMSVITGHLLVPSLENKDIATSLSAKAVNDLLKTKMGFRGLVITDALNMQGATKGNSSVGEIELQAFLAGNDLLLMPENAIAGMNRIKSAIDNGKVSISDLNNRVKKILKAKYWAGLSTKKSVIEIGIDENLNQQKYNGLKQLLYEAAVTVASNNDNLIPLAKVEGSKKLVSISIGAELGNSFQKTLLRFNDFQLFSNESRSDNDWYNSLLNSIDSGKTVVVSLHKLTNYPSRRYGISPLTMSFLTKLQKRNKVILVVLGNPYSLKYFSDINNLVCGYEDDPLAQEAAAQVVVGALPSVGLLPVSIGKRFSAGDGLYVKSSQILGFSLPEAVGINSVALTRIDNIVNSAITQKIMPGCNMLIIKNGKIAYTKSFGNLRYESSQKVNQYTVYDLASVTKVAGTLQAIMKLKDMELLSIKQKASFYLPELDSTNKSNITIENLLLHQAGLHGYLPFWENTKVNKKLDTTYYSRTKSDKYPFTVANGLYGNQILKDSLWHWVVTSPMITRRTRLGEYPFLYSDLGLIILQKVIERISGMPLDKYCDSILFKPLQLERTGFNIYEKVTLDQIAPTENDIAFRGLQIKGTVQDQQAAMMGGVSGHAGLFGSLFDLGKIMQMNLNKGFYGGQRFFESTTVDEFTKSSSNKSHRALGWDKQPDDKESNYISSQASDESYGHSGYTGTMVWVDPKYDLIFVFLANRVYPNASNNKMNALKIRRKIHDVVYQSILNSNSFPSSQL